jgi:hypothetical protein
MKNQILDCRLMAHCWCEDPDEAFNIGCNNLGVEDWCKDNSLCPLQGKDKTMFVLVQNKNLVAKKQINLKLIEESDIVLQMNDDRKSFQVIKHRHMEMTEEEYPMSQLKHVLIAGMEK